MSECRFLTCAELELITGKVRPHAQRAELSFMGIPFRLNSNGTPIVFIEDVRSNPDTDTDFEIEGFKPQWETLEK